MRVKFFMNQIKESKYPVSPLIDCPRPEAAKAIELVDEILKLVVEKIGE